VILLLKYLKNLDDLATTKNDWKVVEYFENKTKEYFGG